MNWTLFRFPKSKDTDRNAHKHVCVVAVVGVNAVSAQFSTTAGYRGPENANWCRIRSKLRYAVLLNVFQNEPVFLTIT